MVVSAGNDGPACSTATAPPANYDAVFSVGATNNAGQIVGFSSRGPVDGLVKPDVIGAGRIGAFQCAGRRLWLRRGNLDGGAARGGSGGAASGRPTRPSLGDVEGTEQLICRTASPSRWTPPARSRTRCRRDRSPRSCRTPSAPVETWPACPTTSTGVGSWMPRPPCGRR